MTAHAHTHQGIEITEAGYAKGVKCPNQHSGNRGLVYDVGYWHCQGCGNALTYDAVWSEQTGEPIYSVRAPGYASWGDTDSLEQARNLLAEAHDRGIDHAGIVHNRTNRWVG